jgi:hypothetical protein
VAAHPQRRAGINGDANIIPRDGSERASSLDIVRSLGWGSVDSDIDVAAHPHAYLLDSVGADAKLTQAADFD